MALVTRRNSTVAAVAAVALALVGATAARADAVPGISLGSFAVTAGDEVVVSSDGWTDLAKQIHPSTTVLISSDLTGVIARDEFPATAGPWTRTVTIPMFEPAGTYQVCAVLTKDVVAESEPWMEFSTCASLTVRAYTLPGSPVYRFWSPRFSNAHFFTMSTDEAAGIRSTDTNWIDEGVAFRALPVNPDLSCTYGKQVFRFWSPVFRTHFYTQDAEEKSRIRSTDRNWTYEGIAYCALTSTTGGGVPLYRFWSPVFNKHFFTASQSEADNLQAVDRNWNYEGIAYYVLPS